MAPKEGVARGAGAVGTKGKEQRADVSGPATFGEEGVLLGGAFGARGVAETNGLETEEADERLVAAFVGGTGEGLDLREAWAEGKDDIPPKQGKGGGKGPMGQTVGVDEGAEVFGRGVGEGDVVRREHPETMEQERPARLGRRGVRHRG